ncbi:MAG: hypothetical protein FJ144_05615 [Deltaproteobacteria bacterium]|nr:hypothetical protein [Deltaproteobacteria bacterium]
MTLSAEAEIEALLGGDPAADHGVIQVTSVTRPRDAAAPLETIAVGPDAPRSATDRFLLSLARARADAIVTTGKILRAEPDVRHSPLGSTEEIEALRRWRHDHLAKRDEPWSVVLSRGTSLDLDHPLFRPPARPLLLVPEETARRIEPAARAAGIRVLGRPEPSLEDSLAVLAADFGCETITVEAGPSTSRSLWGSPTRVDELLLSIFEEHEDVPRAGAFSTEARLEAALGRPRASQSRVEESGLWTFRRYRRNRLAPCGSDG